MNFSRQNTLAWLIILGSFAIKIYYIFHFTHYADSVQFDMATYWFGAFNRLDGQTHILTQYVIFPTFYIFFNTEFLRILKFLGFLNNALTISIICHALLYSISAYIFYLISDRLIVKKSLALCSLILYAFSYTAAYLNALVLPENLAIPLMVITVGNLILGKLNKKILISLGLLLGIIVSAKPVLLFLTVVLISYVGYLSIKESKYWNIVIIILAFLVIPAWTVIENYKISSGKLIGLGSYGGANFLAGWTHAGKIISSSSDGNWWVCGTPFLDGSNKTPLTIHEPFYHQGVYYKLGLEAILQDPMVLLKKILWFKNLFVGLFTPTHFVAEPPGNSQWMLLTQIIHTILFIGAILSFIFFRSHPYKKILLLLYCLLISFFAGLYVMGFPEKRYFFSIEFLCILLFFVTIDRVSQKHQQTISTCNLDKPNYFSGLDGLRCFAVLWVILHHMVNSMKEAATQLPNWLIYIAGSGTNGVIIFFVISGFLITGLLIKTDYSGDINLKRFYSRRSFKILPTYFLFLGVVFLMYWNNDFLNATGINADNRPHMWLYLFFMQSYIIPIPILAHTWSLAVEEHFYFFYPLLLKFIYKINQNQREKIIISVISILILAGYFLREYLLTHNLHQHYIINQAPFAVVDCFLIGCLLRITIKHWSKISIQSIYLIGILGCVLFSYLIANEIKYYNKHGCFWIYLASALVLIAVVRDFKPLSVLMNLPFVRWVGKISYAVYLWHYLILAIFLNIYQQNLSIPLNIICLIVILLVGWISTNTVEKYFLHIREKLSS